jgi:uncharacterized protein YfaS (alpha-2-macroglobulin family)
MLKQILIVWILLFCVVPPTFSQTQSKKDAYSKEWNKVDSLMNSDFPKSAQSVVEKIYANAKTQHDMPTQIKAQIYLLKTKYGNEENSTKQQIQEMELLIAQASGVEKAIWQSLTAELYYTYYQNNRYQLYKRTPLASTTSGDIDTWDVPALLDHTASLFEASLDQKELLQATPVEQYMALVTKGTNTQGLRPTLYDLLSFKVIGFFENGETGVTQAGDAFQMDGNLWFETAERFSSVRVKVKDGSSFKFRTLKLYQNILAFHLRDAKPEALIDADLQRLQFVYSNSVNAQKDSLYVNALQDIVNRYPKNEATAQASYLIVNQKMGEAPVRKRFQATATTKKDRNLPEIKMQLEAIISKFPKSEGAINAQNLLVQINLQQLSLQTEQVNIPNENIKALVTYKNLSSVYLKLYRFPHHIGNNGRENTDSILEKLKKLTPLRTWQQALPGGEDMEDHSAEIKVDALPTGNYALIASDGSKDSIVVYSAFQVSNISMVMQQKDGQRGFILNRKTGYPLANVKSYFYGRSYSGNKELMPKLGMSTSETSGMIHFPLTNTSDYSNAIQGMLFVDGADTLYLNSYVYNERSVKQPQQTIVATYFFTDRAIYRPGQTLYFKGIMVKSSNGGRQNEVAADQSSTVILYDVNGQNKGSVIVKSNQFGSFSGTFQLPDGLLNGNMHISNGSGNQYFSVEEYKRPKFYIDFDTLKGSYSLNESVTVKGFAKAYAGNNIDGAQVKYRVVRKVIFPYYWCYYLGGMPNATETEIANGSAITGADGSFEVAFETMPDKTIDSKTMPVFHYFVYVDVTDQNGETHSGNVQVNSGYTIIQIDAQIEEQSKPKDLAQLKITTQNLNGIFTPATVNIAVARLKFPGFYRERLWQMPDQFVMSESEFHKAFPQDAYKDEGNHLNWEKEKVLFEKSFTTTADGLVDIPASTWYQNGWYVIEIKTKDAKGNDIVEKKYTHVWAPGKKEQTQEALIAYTEKDSYQPGDKIELWFDTGIDQPHLLHSATIDYNARRPVYIDVQEKDRGGMVFSWLYVSNSRVYTLSKRIDVPWSNKDLQLEWATHRDKLLPGAKDEWTLTIKGNKKEKVAAELLAGMYDASLDAFKPHNWDWDKLFPSVYDNNVWSHNWGFGSLGSEELVFFEEEDDSYFEKIYNQIFFGNGMRLTNSDPSGKFRSAVMMSVMPAPAAEAADIMPYRKSEGNAMGVVGGLNDGISADKKAATSPTASSENNPNEPVQIRQNLQETAFFFPQLKTDADGNVKFSFTIPEALTEWKLMAFAHTKDWKTGYLQGKVKTQKDLMVVPNLPRFFRQNDNIQISAKVVNLSASDLNGNATIELLDAQTLQPIPLTQFQQNPWSANEGSSKSFSVQKGQSTTVTWNLHIAESRYTPLLVRIIAKSGAFSDGEENTLPVITNRMLVTETLPISIKGNTTQTFTLDKLLNNNSNTLLNHGLTVEFTGNPAWYAVQALPYLMEYPYECAEQTFNRFYANALAQNIVSQSPKVKQIFDQWQNQDSAALVSNLQKNEELKTALLEETPWVMEAKDETEQKHRIALLFQTNKMAKELGRAMDKLAQMQLSDGSFPWFKGMYGDRYITQYILTGMGRLQHLGVKQATAKESMREKALNYADAMLKNDYDDLVKSKADMALQQISNYQAMYFYMRSFYANVPVNAVNKKAYDFYKTQAIKYWSSFNPYLKGQLALALNRIGEEKAASLIVASLRETAIHNKDLGMYWKDMPKGYYWSEAPIEAQSVLIEAFGDVAKDNDAVDEMKLWLLKQKQTQNWETTKATADACYALLLNGSNWLTVQPEVTIQLGSEKIKSSEVKTEAGSGYFKKSFAGKDVKKDMGNIQVAVQYPASETSKPTSWGAVYWQYFEDMDKITGGTAPISLKKQLFIEQNSAKGPVLTAIENDNALSVGAKVKIRIELKVDRDMEYVQLKDMRAACFEPIDVLSSYQYQNGTGYYQSTKDLATNFFFDHLRKGTYVFEYPVWVNAKGDFSNSISTIQCMYAPEFSSHTEGLRVEVK